MRLQSNKHLDFSLKIKRTPWAENPAKPTLTCDLQKLWDNKWMLSEATKFVVICCSSTENYHTMSFDFTPPCHFYTCCPSNYLLIYPCYCYGQINQHLLSNYYVPSIALNGKYKHEWDTVCTGALKNRELHLIQWRFEMRELQHLTGLGTLDDRHIELTLLGKDMKRYYKKRKTHGGMKWSVMFLKGQTIPQHKHIVRGRERPEHRESSG